MPRFGRWSTALLTVGALVIAVGGGVWWLAGTRGVAPFHKPVTTDGRTLTVTYLGNECQDGSRLEVDEQEQRVIVTVHRWSRATECSDVGVDFTLTHVLSRPLGDRQVVDGACEEPQYRGRSDCTTQ